MRILILCIMGLLPAMSFANERVLGNYVNKYNTEHGQKILLRNVRNHANLWSGWIDRIEDGTHTWGTFVALVDEGEITYWHTFEIESDLLEGNIDGAEAGQIADFVSSAFALSAVGGAVELNPLGFPFVGIGKYVVNEWAEKQDLNDCVSSKRMAGKFGWAATGWNLASAFNPILGIIAAVTMYRQGGELAENTLARGCQAWIGPVVINAIPSSMDLAKLQQAGPANTADNEPSEGPELARTETWEQPDGFAF